LNQPAAVGTILNKRFRILRLVGGGGMAWVYQVEELPAGSGRLWALKELRPQTDDRTQRAASQKLFEQEARLLRSLSHPAIPAIADYFEESGRAYLVMEFIWGESLEKRLEKANAPLLETDVLHWAVQLCDALEYLHGLQPPIIFRDLKPSNVMVSNAGEVKLIDFGIARTFKTGKKRDTVAMGSENYAAPEQWGKGQTDARSDVYALGATLYHLLANLAPTPAFLPSEPLPLANYNQAASRATILLIEKAMARERSKRFQSAGEMRAALIAALPEGERQAVLAKRQPVGKPEGEVSGPPAAVSGPSAASKPPAVPVTNPPTKQTPAPVASAVPTGRGRGGHTPSPAPAKSPAPGAAESRGESASHRPALVCPVCRRAVKAGGRFCVACGTPFTPVGPAVLRVVAPVRAAWEMPVARSPMLLGRTSEAEEHRPDFDMAFYDDGGYVSRRHARITKGQAGYFLVDLGSSNGTSLNGYPLLPNRAYRLRNGDRFQVGLVVIEFRTR
jgi:serine/threonine-protein kinase